MHDRAFGFIGFKACRDAVWIAGPVGEWMVGAGVRHVNGMFEFPPHAAIAGVSINRFAIGRFAGLRGKGAYFD
jgi:hypothetical protein